MVVYKFNCFCKDSYGRMTFRQFCKRFKEHISKSIDEFCKISNLENESIRVVNASKRSAIAEHLVNNIGCASNYIYIYIYKAHNIFCYENLSSVFFEINY